MTSRLLKTAERMEWERIKNMTPPVRMPRRKAVDAMMDKENEGIREVRKRRMMSR